MLTSIGSVDIRMASTGLEGRIVSAACPPPGCPHSVGSPEKRSPSVTRCGALIAESTGPSNPALAVPISVSDMSAMASQDVFFVFVHHSPLAESEKQDSDT